MPDKKQMLVTVFALVTGSFFINLVWILCRHRLYGETGMPLPVVLIGLFVTAAGVSLMLYRTEKIHRNNKMLTLCNCIASVNFATSVTSAVFIYFFNGSKLTLNLIPLLVPLFIAVFIFEKIFLRLKRQGSNGITARETACQENVNTLNNETNISV